MRSNIRFQSGRKGCEHEKKCSDDEEYLKDYIAGFTKASKEQNRTVKYEWIGE